MPVDEHLLAKGRQLHAAGQPGPAQQIYRQILAADPHNVDVLNLMGAACVDLQQWVEAASYLNEALRHDQNFAAAHENWGVLLAKQNRLSEAIDSFRRAAALNPQGVQTHLNLANALMHGGRAAEAAEVFQRVLELAPDTAKAHEEIARVRFLQGQMPQAIYHIRHLIRLMPHEPRWRFDLAVCLTRCGQNAEAIAAYRDVLRISPDSAESCVNLGNLLSEDKQVDEAIACYRRAIQIRPDFPEALINLGRVLNTQKKYDEARAQLERAIAVKPEMTAGYNNLGITLGEMGQFSAAAECYLKALAIHPEDPDLHYNLGIALLKTKQIDGALSRFERALAIKPDYAEAHHNHSAALLMTGRLREGFAEYEWRFRSRDMHEPQPRWPLWDGTDPAGRTIVLCSEQGLGDTFQFVRYASWLKKRGARVIVECQQVLHPILARTPGVDAWIAQRAPAPPADCCVRMMSMPYLTGATLETIPAEVPYVFADPRLEASWKERLAEIGGFKVGIVWQGNNLCPGDQFRSIALEHFAPLTAIGGVRLISLQKGVGSEQLGDVAERWQVVDFGDSLDVEPGAFMDTAAIMRNLDLVITSDTAAAHLAGALGVSFWVALPYVPDWRWLLDREDSPWYPTARLFRQPELFDWTSVFERIAAELATLVARHAAPVT